MGARTMSEREGKERKKRKKEKRKGGRVERGNGPLLRVWGEGGQV